MEEFLPLEAPHEEEHNAVELEDHELAIVYSWSSASDDPIGSSSVMSEHVCWDQVPWYWSLGTLQTRRLQVPTRQISDELHGCEIRYVRAVDQRHCAIELLEVLIHIQGCWSVWDFINRKRIVFHCGRIMKTIRRREPLFSWAMRVVRRCPTRRRRRFEPTSRNWRSSSNWWTTW